MNKLLFILFIMPTILWGQRDSLLEGFGGVVYLDSMTVKASRAGFNVDDFIVQVQTDKTFYQSFKNIRLLPYKANNSILIKNKNQKVKAQYESVIQQNVAENCRTMQILEESVKGNYFKKDKEYRYYTAKLFDRVFYTHGEVCETDEGNENTEQAGGLEKQYNELKKLIFSPGQEADVPLIGKKTAIFSEDMRPYYDFSIKTKDYKDGTPCYVFIATVKPDFKEQKTVIKYLETWFSRDNFQITARNYHLNYYGLMFDFDVEMKIKLSEVKGEFLPTTISYKGFFDVPLKKPEYGEFNVSLQY